MQLLDSNKTKRTQATLGYSSPHNTRHIIDAPRATHALLYRLGVSANYKGFSHTAYAISLCLERQDRLLLVTKWLYPDVAKKYGTNWKAVERNIRTASSIAWLRNRPLLESLTQRSLDRRLRPAEFLALLTHTVQPEYESLSVAKGPEQL